MFTQNVDIVNAMIRCGANINTADSLGVMPLQYSRKFVLTTITNSITNGMTNMYFSSPPIDWNGNWAYGCNFDTNNLDILSVTTPSKCSWLCSGNNSCTHYTWMSYNGGYCFLKTGILNKSMSISTNNNNIICSHRLQLQQQQLPKQQQL